MLESVEAVVGSIWASNVMDITDPREQITLIYFNTI